MNFRSLDLGLLVIRLGFGLGFVWFHGLPKLLGGPERWAGVGSAMGNFGIDFGHQWWGLLAAVIETFGGLFLGAGLFFRPVSLALMAVMLAASVNHIVTGQGSPGHALKNAFLFIGLAFTGPGRYSVDAWWRRRRTGGAAV